MVVSITGIQEMFAKTTHLHHALILQRYIGICMHTCIPLHISFEWFPPVKLQMSTFHVTDPVSDFRGH